MNEQIEQLHKRLLIIMEEIHGICVKNHIRYSLAGGSLIGAMRHKGFIPWDDDMDIMMPYDDFVRFKNIVCSDKHDWLEFKVAGTPKDYYRTIMRAYDSRTTLIPVENSIPYGIFIDIFPFVCVGNKKWKAKSEYYLHRMFEAPLMRKVNVYPNKNIIKEFLLTSLGKVFPTSFWVKGMDWQYNRLRNKHTKYSSDMDGSLKGIVLTEYLLDFELKEFEGHLFYCITRADEYLRSVFGDYMKLPSKEKRVPHHIAYLNVNLPYRFYNINER